jgi:hypothetical protein
MAALHSPFSSDNMSLALLIERIEKCDYKELPEEIYSPQLRGLVKLCLNLNQQERPNMQQILELANQMFTHFQSTGQLTPHTPSPMEMQQSLKQ